MGGLLDQLANNVGEELKKDFDAKIKDINKRFDKIEKKLDLILKKI